MAEQKRRRKPGPPPGRRPKGDRETVLTRVPAHLKPRLQRIAKARGLPLSELVSTVLEEWVPQAELEEGLPQQGQFDIEIEKSA